MSSLLSCPSAILSQHLWTTATTATFIPTKKERKELYDFIGYSFVYGARISCFILLNLTPMHRRRHWQKQAKVLLAMETSICYTRPEYQDKISPRAWILNSRWKCVSSKIYAICLSGKNEKKLWSDPNYYFFSTKLFFSIAIWIINIQDFLRNVHLRSSNTKNAVEYSRFAWFILKGGAIQIWLVTFNFCV